MGCMHERGYREIQSRVDGAYRGNRDDVNNSSVVSIVLHLGETDAY